MNQNLCPFCFEPLPGLGPCPHCGHQIGEPMQGVQQLPVGWILDGKYRIGMTLGQGGFGITYLAYDMNLQQKIAIKEYFPSGLVTRNSQFVTPSTQSGQGFFLKGVDAFYREARLLVQFSNHPNVVHIQNFFRENNTAYFVMEYVEGKSLAAYLYEKGGRLSQEETISLLNPIMDALDTLHQAGILHRDIATDNIYLTKSGQVKLLDFGAAKNELSQHTHSSAAILKPGYAPLEQYSVTGNQGPWTDVYAMGAVFYRCLTGTMPPDAPDRITGREIIPISANGAKISKNVEAAVMKALALNIPERWQRMVDFKNALSDPSIKISTPKTQTRTSNVKKKTTKKASQKKSSKGIIWIGLILTLIGVLFSFMLFSGKIPFLQLNPTPTMTATPTITPLPTITLANIPSATVMPTSTPTKMPYVSGKLNVGDEIVFGTYEQNYVYNDGKEGIEWQVLAVENGRALMISKLALDAKPYHENLYSQTWSSCSLRTWLNYDFFNDAFSKSEKDRIVETIVHTPNNPDYGTDGGPDTNDRIFLLSIDEVNKYFVSLSDRECEASALAKNHGAFVNQDNGKSRWWLRSSGYSSTDAAYVEFNGNIPTHGNVFSDNTFSVRPAFWLDISAPQAGDMNVDNWHLGILVNSIDNELWAQEAKGAELFADSKDDVEAHVLITNGDENKEMQVMRDFIAQYGDHSIFVIDPASNANTANLVEIAEEAGVKVAMLWRHADELEPADFNSFVVHVSPDDYVSGYNTAKYLFNKIGGKGKVVALYGKPGEDTAAKRYAGFQDALSEYPQIELLDMQIAFWSQDQALTFTQTWLSTYEHIDAIWAANDTMGLGAIEALKLESRNGQILVCGCDGIVAAYEAIEAGDMTCTVANNGYLLMGYGASYAYQAAKNGLKVEKPVIKTQAVLVTTENVIEYKAIFIDGTPEYDFDDLSFCVLSEYTSFNEKESNKK